MSPILKNTRSKYPLVIVGNFWATLATRFDILPAKLPHNPREDTDVFIFGAILGIFDPEHSTSSVEVNAILDFCP